MGVHLREKKLEGGQVSFYLDIYHNKKRWYEFLEIRINKNRPTAQDKEKKRLAQEIRSKREHELIVLDNCLVDKVMRKADFLQWFEQYIKDKRNSDRRMKYALKHMRCFVGDKPLAFGAVTPELIKGFMKHLLTKVSENTASDYIRNLFTALEEAVRLDIILQNPIRKIQRHERIKRTPIFRNAFTLEELQSLLDAPCKIKPQYRQAYLFSCFTGLRWSDINSLRWSEIITKTIDNQEEWFLHFQQEKTDDIEYLPMSGQAVAILKERKMEIADNGEKSPYVFPLIKEPHADKNIMNRHVNAALKKWAKAAGIDQKRIHFHTARHTFATNVLENSPEADLWTVSKLLGHKSIIPTQIYAHVRDSRKRAAINGLPMLKAASTEAA